jgi:hypothetical protein
MASNTEQYQANGIQLNHESNTFYFILQSVSSGSTVNKIAPLLMKWNLPGKISEIIKNPSQGSLWSG